MSTSRRGKYQAADEDIDPILKASPNQFMANYLRGLELAKQQKYAEAHRIFDRISQGFAAHWAGYYLQGLTKFALGQYAEAEASLGKYLADVPEDMRAARLIATAALQRQAASYEAVAAPSGAAFLATTMRAPRAA
jgi:predicted Zn-dependent protease